MIRITGITTFTTAMLKGSRVMSTRKRFLKICLGAFSLFKKRRFVIKYLVNAGVIFAQGKDLPCFRREPVKKGELVQQSDESRDRPILVLNGGLRSTWCGFYKSRVRHDCF